MTDDTPASVTRRSLRRVPDLPDTTTPPLRLDGITPDGSSRSQLVAELIGRFELADRRGAVARARQLLASGLDDRELREIVGAAVRHVGDLWQAGLWTIAQEHAATAIAEAVLTSLEATASHAAPVGTVAVGAADGEWHALPARLASHAFELAGLDVRYLGAGVPADDVERTLRAGDADVLAVSVTVSANLRGAARTVAAGHAAGLPVLAGGAAMTAARARAIGADGYAPSVDEGAELARRWCEEGAPALATADLATGASDTLTAARHGLRDAAFGRVVARWPDLDHATTTLIDRITEDLDLHLDHLAAALALRDEAVYGDLLPWLRHVQAGRGLPETLLDAQVDAVADVLDDHPEARDLVVRAHERLGVPEPA